jgi:hypothetical protein
VGFDIAAGQVKNGMDNVVELENWCYTEQCCVRYQNGIANENQLPVDFFFPSLSKLH